MTGPYRYLRCTSIRWVPASFTLKWMNAARWVRVCIHHFMYRRVLDLGGWVPSPQREGAISVQQLPWFPQAAAYMNSFSWLLDFGSVPFVLRPHTRSRNNIWHFNSHDICTSPLVGGNRKSEPIQIFSTLNLSSLGPSLKALDLGIACYWRPCTDRPVRKRKLEVWWPFHYEYACT